MAGSILGTRVTRVEDPQLLRGRATYVDNLEHPGALRCHFVRSTMAHARISAVGVEAAKAIPGVHSIWLADDLGLDDYVPAFPLNPKLLRSALASGRVRFVGEPVALIVAESREIAEDAAEAVVIEYEELDPVVDMEKALAAGAPVIDEQIERNLVGSTVAGNDHDPLADAEVTVAGRFVNQRMAVVPMETNSIAAYPSKDGEPMLVYVSTQMPHLFHNKLAKELGLPKEEIRVISPNVGGGFGGKAGLAAEYLAVARAAQLSGSALRWVETREENLVSMQGRGQVQYVELGMTRDGRFTGMRCRMIGDAGAQGGFGGGLVLGSTKSMAQGVYSIPKISFLAAAASTTTAPVGALRGAGRPEAASFLERIVDMAAAKLGIDPAELRFRNMIARESFPYHTLMGPTYDSGDYQSPLRKVLEIAGYEELRQEQARRRKEGDPIALGIGISCYVEVTAGGGGSEFGAVEITPEGGAVIRVGTSGHGQGHQTTFSMLVSDTLKIPMDKIEFIQSDTKEVPRGGGTGGSRSLQLGGTAVAQAAKEVLAIARKVAANHFEANPDDIVVSEVGSLHVAGSPSISLSWSELRNEAERQGEELAYQGDFKQGGATFPFGAHLSVVEVDTETGRVRALRHIAVDDCGRVLNPLVVEGQQHGGIAQGIAQALYEEMSFDEWGTPRNLSLAEYLVPSAAELPSFETANTETPSPLNPLGAKGIGESATVGSTPAVQNAIVDALAHLGVRHIDMPATPERVWRAIQEGGDAVTWREPPEIFSDILANAATAEAAEEIDI
ncbi:MAG: xanthine dehydrogenase family protein molybdopterin-binding subunit [Actinomycetota bacterium]|nr:xanthine dehydrogenase family protein molybdopterin-binding subunit [Actinomycetota bacterium]